MVNDAGIDLIKKWEQCRLDAFKPVPTDPWTIGWGRTRGVQEGDTCTQEQADQWQLEDIGYAEEVVQNAVTVDLTEGQYAALVSFVYNVGPGIEGERDGLCHLASGGPSHLLIYTNAQEFDKAAEQFLAWDKSGGIVLQGLLNRRKDERALYLS